MLGIQQSSVNQITAAGSLSSPHSKSKNRESHRRQRISHTIRGYLCLLFLFLAASFHPIHGRIGDFVSTDYNCYEAADDSITVRFSTGMPTMQNWIGLIREKNDNDDGEKQEHFFLSSWACGSHDDECTEQNRHRVTFANLTSIPPGTYTARLKSHGYHGHTQTLESSSFQILASCSSNSNDNDNGDIISMQTPHSSRDSIQVSDPHYTIRSNHQTIIEVLFGRSHPTVFDAVGIYPMEITWENLSVTPPLLWVWTACAAAEEEDYACPLSETPSVSAPHGFLSFHLTSGMLETGHYQAVLGQAKQSKNSNFLLTPIASTAETPFFVVDTTISTAKTGSPYLVEGADPPCTESEANKNALRPIVVQTSSSCFGQGEDIPVSFSRLAKRNCPSSSATTNALKQATDMVAIYPVPADFASYNGTTILPPPPRLWLYTCGSKNCPGETQEETFHSTDESSSMDLNTPSDWPLPIGSYKTVLIRRHWHREDTAQASYLYYESEPFQVVAGACPDLETSLRRRFLRDTSRSRHLSQRRMEEAESSNIMTTTVIFS